MLSFRVPTSPNSMAEALRRRVQKLMGMPLLALCVLSVLSGPLAAQERILAFDSEIWIDPDSTMVVRETITVVSQGQKIKRGIFRDFPTDYRDRYGNKVSVGFVVEEVRRDGNPEPYHTERRGNGVRVYIGDKDVFIPSGRHVYEITYRTNRQLGFFEGFDELYWNVTGNGWDFVIEHVKARVHLPRGAVVEQFAAYTGFQGDQGQNFIATGLSDGIEFETTRPLASRQGLTIAVSWPPGFVTRPSASQELSYMMADNRALVVGVIGLALLILYYALMWLKVGRDPAKGTIVPLYQPPSGVSPAGARYVSRMGYDDTVFAAAVVSMAVKGYLTIKEGAQKVYTLQKTGQSAKLSPGESALARKLFRYGGDSIVLKQKNHKTLKAAQRGLREWLRTEFEGTYFLRNRAYFLPGLGLSLLVLLAMVAFAREPLGAAFISVWLSIWSIGVYALGRTAWRAWRDVFRGGDVGSIGGALLLTVIGIPFFGGELFGLAAFIEFVSWGGAAILLLVQITNVVFYHLLKAPTMSGRRMMDQIDGFKDYLSVAEKDRMNFHNPPERTPELFERYLPYALALGVEQAWAEQFASVLSAASQSGDHGRSGYRPRWYSGNSFDGNIGRLSSSLGSGFSSAISSASTAPGSSSGSSGGGSSGGGGGGGGGGGW